jgi:hypothetical protein
MSRDVLTRYFKESLLEAKQTPICVGDPPKKPTTRDKIEPLSFKMWDLKVNKPR